MPSTSRQVTRTVRTRSWRDIDPKVAAGAAIASLVTLVLGTLLYAGRISPEQFVTTFLAVWGVVSAGYLKRSADTDAAASPAQVAADVLAVVAPLVKDAVPEAKQVVEQVEDAVGEIEAQLASPTPAPVAYRI